ncbi:MAG TPA: PEP-CTERM sorting domain-containing protein [Nostocaceae cyanobacterium]|nr:PEP-CTERM sorting domain-containing protein [Nostocaceae cyanobacterium]
MKIGQKLVFVTSSMILGVAAVTSHQEIALASSLSGEVLAPDAEVNGYSLTQIADEIAFFQDQLSVSVDPSLLPNTPFQLLTVASFDYNVTSDTFFYVPIVSVTDSPPVLGIFPTNSSQNVNYWFAPDQLGGSDFAIVVDGHSTPIGAEYLAGPIFKPLPQGGTGISILGAFLSPLAPGEHTVKIQGKFNGELIGGPCQPEACFPFEISYKVNSQAVPEPGTILGMIFVAGLAWITKQKLRTSKQFM